MRQNLDSAISKIFYDVQFNRTCHRSNIKKLRKYYDQSDLSDFWESFESCFKVLLAVVLNHPQTKHSLEFVAKFATSLHIFTNEESEEPLCPFLIKLYDFLLNNHGAKDPGVRFRICHFLNVLFNSMGEQAFIEDVICNKIVVCMVTRLKDKSPKVRTQALFALRRLQDPTDNECQVIKVYTFHASKDPNAEVRKAALMCMGKNQTTLQVALRRTRDVNEGVRKVAYEFVSKITVRSLTITQRDQLLNDGLKDRSETVRKCVENVLLPSWLRYFNGDFISLIKAFDAEIGTDVSVLALETLFKSSALNTLIEQLPINNETKLIPIDKLTTENVLYWKCLVKHLCRGACTEELERIVPELSIFCTHISDFLTSISINQNETWENHMQKFILLQLFEIATTYDLSDELGRKKLNELICNTLLSNYWSEKIIECVVSHLENVIPDVNSRVDTLAHVISDIRLPLKESTQVTQISEHQQDENNLKRAKLKVKLLELKEEEYQAIEKREFLEADRLQKEINALNQEIIKLSKTVPPPSTGAEDIKEKDDPETMIKCLSIICSMMQSVTSLTPTLGNLIQIGFNSLDHLNDTVHILAIKAISIYCILDKEMAKKHILILFLQFSLEQENQEIWIAALKGILDLLLLHGLECFDIFENRNATTESTNKSELVQLFTEREVTLSMVRGSDIQKNNCDFIKILAGLLDNENQELRTVAAEGIAKLLLNGRISSSSLLSRLIILCYNPANDADFFLRQCLSGFFDNFIIHVAEAQKMLEEAYLPTLQILYKAPDFSPMQEIDPYDVSKFILNITRTGICRHSTKNYCAHNNLVFTIFLEALNPDSYIDQKMLIKSLQNLHLEIDDDTTKESLRQLIKKVLDTVGTSDKQLLNHIETFKQKLETPSSIQDTPRDQTSE
ncbi:condensin complex subunit 3-like [Hylaeus volcanicus]|uniref:condensin complex subunit 3-like n=1 Tax=Hylaeus volcanicus TaxID=313075 RepID=UPI0023B7E7B8|nr:condensin complex subunit 3-like [Hylaeus volcanicus]